IDVGAGDHVERRDRLPVGGRGVDAAALRVARVLIALGLAPRRLELSEPERLLFQARADRAPAPAVDEQVAHDRERPCAQVAPLAKALARLQRALEGFL